MVFEFRPEAATLPERAVQLRGYCVEVLHDRSRPAPHVAETAGLDRLDLHPSTEATAEENPRHSARLASSPLRPFLVSSYTRLRRPDEAAHELLSRPARSSRCSAG